MPWRVDTTARPGILQLQLAGVIEERDMLEFARAHDAGVDSFGDVDYRVFCDLRELKPLSPRCAAIMEQCKAYSAAHANFRGSAVLVQSPTVAMQHRRTSSSGGVMSTELITSDEAACWAHLAKVKR